MDDLFSCRNCIHNAAQTLFIGKGAGFCLVHYSLLKQPSATTCKHLTRKDMPSFVVDEGVRRHAYEYATSPGIVDTTTMETIRKVHYSEKHAWLTGSFDPLTMTLAHSRKITPTVVFVETLAGGVDGRRSLAHASVVRRYMANCDTWTSSYRSVLALVQEMGEEPVFSHRDLVEGGSQLEDALWDLFFVRLSGLQEYGFYAGLEELIWASDSLGEPFIDLNWTDLAQKLVSLTSSWKEMIVHHAQRQGEFFPERGAEEGGVDLEPT